MEQQKQQRIFIVIMHRKDMMGFGDKKRFVFDAKSIEGIDIEFLIAGPEGLIWKDYDKEKYFVEDIIERND